MTTYRYDILALAVAWEDEAQRAEFLVQVEEIDNQAQVERMLSVMNKPSQFVGRVCDFATAQEHWLQWDKWQAENNPEEQLPIEETGTRKRGRPSGRMHNRQAVEKASEAWHAAVAGRKQARLDWAAWRKAEIAKIEDLYQKNLLDWDNFVVSAREELSRVQNN